MNRNYVVCQCTGTTAGQIEQAVQQGGRTFDDVKEKINEFIDDNFAEDDNIHISEDEIVISRTFSDEGDNK